MAGKCDVIVGALARDQANIVDTVESVFSVPSQLTTPVGVSAYEAEVKTAETIASRLAWAVEKYRTTVDGGWDGRLKNAGAKKGELKAKLHARCRHLLLDGCREEPASAVVLRQSVGHGRRRVHSRRLAEDTLRLRL